MTPAQNPIKFFFAILFIFTIGPAPIGIAMLRGYKGAMLWLVVGLVLSAPILAVAVWSYLGAILAIIALILSLWPRLVKNKR